VKTKPNSIAVVIPVFNQSHHTERCLQSLLDHSSLIQELFIVDNGSTDNTGEVLEKFKPKFLDRGWQFTVFKNSENRGFGRACNQGIRASKSEYTLILNNDTWHMQDWDKVMIAEMQRLKVVLIGPSVIEGDFNSDRITREMNEFLKKNKNKWRREFVPLALFYRTDVIQKLDGYDERFFVTSEDDDLRERMDRAGLKYAQVANCIFWHHHMGTRGEVSLPRDYEIEGLKLFKDKWGFDHRDKRRVFYRRWLRSYQRLKRAYGYF